MKHKEKTLKKMWTDLSDPRGTTKKIKKHVTGVPEGGGEGQNNDIWRNNYQNVPKFDENYKPTDARTPNKDKYKVNHTKKHNKITANLKSRQRTRVQYKEAKEYNHFNTIN